jgi:subtilisin family serine protease
VAAAGNDGNTTVNYPAGYESVIAVGATGTGDSRTSYSQYGNWVDIAAPGDKILSTVPNGKYESMSGTSMAGPHVAAAAALVLSKTPGASASAVREALVSTGDAVTGFESNPSLRRLNMAKALGATPTSAPAQPQPTTAPAQPAPQQPAPAQPQPQQPQMPQQPQRPGMPLQVGNLGAANVSANSATIRWATNKSAIGIVEYGMSPRMGQQSAVTAAATQHSATLSNLRPGSMYFYRVHVKDGAGVVRASYLTSFRTRNR